MHVERGDQLIVADEAVEGLNHRTAAEGSVVACEHVLVGVAERNGRGGLNVKKRSYHYVEEGIYVEQERRRELVEEGGEFALRGGNDTEGEEILQIPLHVCKTHGADLFLQ